MSSLSILRCRTGGLGGLPLIRRISAHDPRVRILVFSMHSDPIIVARALEAGASWLCPQRHLIRGFFEGVPKPCIAGSAVFEPRSRHAGRAGATRRRATNPLAELTPRELQTLSLLAKGKPYGHIAEELNVSYKTVVNVSSQLKHKLEVRNLPELIRAAVQLLETAGQALIASRSAA